MKIQKKTIFLYSTIVFMIIFVAKIWGFIKLPYKDPSIIGTYSINEFNSTNDILRYLIFILLPVSFFLLFKIFKEISSKFLFICSNPNLFAKGA